MPLEITGGPYSFEPIQDWGTPASPPAPPAPPAVNQPATPVRPPAQSPDVPPPPSTSDSTSDDASAEAPWGRQIVTGIGKGLAGIPVSLGRLAAGHGTVYPPNQPPKQIPYSIPNPIELAYRAATHIPGEQWVEKQVDKSSGTVEDLSRLIPDIALAWYSGPESVGADVGRIGTSRIYGRMADAFRRNFSKNVPQTVVKDLTDAIQNRDLKGLRAIAASKRLKGAKADVQRFVQRLEQELKSRAAGSASKIFGRTQLSGAAGATSDPSNPAAGYGAGAVTGPLGRAYRYMVHGNPLAHFLPWGLAAGLGGYEGSRHGAAGIPYLGLAGASALANLAAGMTPAGLGALAGQGARWAEPWFQDLFGGDSGPGIDQNFGVPQGDPHQYDTPDEPEAVPGPPGPPGPRGPAGGEE